MEYKIKGGFTWKMIYTEVKEKCKGTGRLSCWVTRFRQEPGCSWIWNRP